MAHPPPSESPPAPLLLHYCEPDRRTLPTWVEWVVLLSVFLFVAVIVLAVAAKL